MDRGADRNGVHSGTQAAAYQLLEVALFWAFDKWSDLRHKGGRQYEKVRRQNLAHAGALLAEMVGNDAKIIAKMAAIKVGASAAVNREAHEAR